MRAHILIGVMAMLCATSGTAQIRGAPTTPTANDDDSQSGDNQPGRVAQSSVGQVGQRQTRDSAASETGIKPMARIANRIQNRVQNRIRNRIDQNYDPQANATNPFAIAEEQTRAVNPPR